MQLRRSSIYRYNAQHQPLAALTEVRELFHYRYLLWNLITRDVKLRYRRTYLGFIWAMMNPLLKMTILVFVFRSVFHSQVEHYAVYVLSGMLLWEVFARGTATAMAVVQQNSEIRKRIYVPAAIFVLASISGAVINFLFALLPLILLTLADGIRPQADWLLLIIPVIALGLFSLGVGLIMSTLSALFADTANIYEVALYGYFYLTPVIYPIEILPLPLQLVQRVNPMFAILDSFRLLLMTGTLPDAASLLGGLAGGLITALLGWLIFTRHTAKLSHNA